MLAAVALLLAHGSARASTLVLHYDFENASNLGQDSSGRGNDGAVTSVSQAAGRGAGEMAGSFDEGLSSRILKSGGLAGYDGRPGFTFAAWFKRSGTGYDGIVSQDTGGTPIHRLLLASDNDPYIDVGVHADREYQSTGISSNTWTHIVMTAENRTTDSIVHVYVDGVEVFGTPATNQIWGLLPDASAYATYVGVGEAGTAHYASGLLDDVQIYDGALTAAEVQSLYQTGTASPVPEPATASIGLAGAAAIALARRRARAARAA